MSRHNEREIKQAIEELLQTYRLKEGIQTARLQQSWEKIMGKLVSKHTLDIKLKDNILYLKISSAPLKNELLFAKEKIIQLLNEALETDAIKDVKIG